MCNSVSRCNRGVYLASFDEVRSVRARYCSFCIDAVNNDILLRKPVRKTKGGA
jgi:hypothetical protein